MRFKGVLRRKCDALFPVQTTHLCFDKQKTTYHSKENVILKAGGSERRKLIRYLEKLMTLYKIISEHTKSGFESTLSHML